MGWGLKDQRATVILQGYCNLGTVINVFKYLGFFVRFNLLLIYVLSLLQNFTDYSHVSIETHFLTKMIGLMNNSSSDVSL